jgi:predicted TIM-barrel fold metal-dependent hydrolase
MRDANVRAARIFPVAHKFPFSRLALGELLEALEEEKIPLFGDMGRNHWSETKLDWEEVFAICETFANLPIVLIREGGTTQRILYSAWKRYPNLYLETSYLQVPECLDYISHQFGAERLLFGTNMPIHDPGGPMAMLELSHLSPTQQAQIAGNNLRRLLHTSPPAPLILGEGGMGEGPGVRCIFDVHGHLGRWEQVYCSVGTIDETIAAMDRFNIGKFAISDFLAIGPDYYSGNTRVGEAVKKYPDRIVGYAVYNPNYESKMEDEMKRCFDELGLTAIKLHCGTHAVSVEDQRYRKAFVIANERHAPVLVHGGPSAAFLRGLLSDYPNLYFILAHVGGSTIDGMGQMIEVAREFPNLIFELASSVCHRGFLAWLVNQIGSEQIVYGSDFPIMDFGWQLGRVLHASISEQDKQKILFENANRIFSA